MPGFFIGNGLLGPATGPSNVRDAARRYQYIINLNIPNTQPALNKSLDLFVLSCDRPRVSFETIKIHHGMNVITRPGKVSYKPITMKFYEILSKPNDAGQINSTTKRFYDWWANSFYNINTSTLGNFKRSVSRCNIIMSNGSGDPVWNYTLYNMWPNELDPNSLDYSANEMQIYSITLNYDLAVEN